jgi:hypothetical protein
VSQTQRADPGARRTALLVVIAAGALGALLLWIAERRRPALEAWLAEDPATRVWLLLAVLVVATSGPVLVLAGYLWRLGARARRAGRFPPPDAALLRDTAVLGGTDAQRVARAMQVVAALLALAGLAIPVLCWMIARALQR